MRFFLILFLWSNFSFSQVKLLSWNVENLGKSKSNESIQFIASSINSYDVVALQEVVAGYGGAQAVGFLVDELNRMGSKWDYVVSEPTSSSSYKAERYAFLWKTSRVKKIGNAWLENKYTIEIDREPFFCTFSFESEEFTLVNFHAITKKMQPETEIKYFKYFFDEYKNLNLIFAGDFNCPQSHSVFNPWRKMGYLPVFVGQKTSLKKSCENDTCLSSEFDNIWLNSATTEIINAEAIHFYKDFESLELARKISDHIPITVTFKLQ